MKTGKIPGNILDRSVVKHITYKRPDEVVRGSAVASDYTAFKSGDNDKIITSTNSISETDILTARMSVCSAFNNVCAAGAKAFAALAHILLPEGYEEEDLRILIDDIVSTCMEYDSELAGGHTEVTTAVNRPVITITAFGRTMGDMIGSDGAIVGDDIVMTKWAAIEGTAILASKHEDSLKQRFSPAFVDEAISFSQYVSVSKEALCATEYKVHAMHDVSKSGVFGALWELGDASGKGLTVDMMSIPIRQETVEICEELGANPYEMLSGGSLLISCENGYDMVRELDKIGVPATVIGKITDNNDRIIINGDEKRYLYRPTGDAININ